MAHVSDSSDGSNSQEQEQERPVLDVSDSAAAQRSGNDKEEQQSLDSLNNKASAELEVKKKRLLQELESALVPKDGAEVHQDLPPPLNPVRPLGIEVIDETALLDTIPYGTQKNGKHSRKRSGKGNGAKNKNKNKEDPQPQSQPPIANSKNNAKYSRKEMEALRFVNVAQQRKFWKAIYAALETAVANEYDTLALATTQLQCLPKKKQAPPILSAKGCENMYSESQLKESSENVIPVDPSCSHSLMGVDGCSISEECSEDDDSEDDNASIQRPAFLVAGEPNFDSGPPEDGWEYLRRVRWEADQIPKVKVAKLDRSKHEKEQSAYMPKIPDIAKCPEHLLPMKQWEDVFLAEFSALRRNLSCLEGSRAIMHSSNLQPVHSYQLLGNNFGESASVMNRDVLLNNHLNIGKAIDQPINMIAEDRDSALHLKNPGSKTSIDQASSSSLSPPLLSAILGMDSVARVSMLQKRIRLLEPANTITRNDCMWLFALCATVDAPLYADTSAALRSLLRKCASIRAGKAELDDEVVMLNILATISGRYFGQSEN